MGRDDDTVRSRLHCNAAVSEFELFWQNVVYPLEFSFLLSFQVFDKIKTKKLLISKTGKYHFFFFGE